MFEASLTSPFTDLPSETTSRLFWDSLRKPVAVASLNTSSLKLISVIPSVGPFIIVREAGPTISWCVTWMMFENVCFHPSPSFQNSPSDLTSFFHKGA